MAYSLGFIPNTVAREYTIPGGHAGIEATVRRMRAIVRGALRVPLLVETAADIVASAGGSTEAAERIRAWLDRHTEFVHDPVGVELIKTPRYMLQEIAHHGTARGDCDDVAVLGAALGKAVGLPARFVLLGFKEGAPFEHVYAELLTDSGWLELDTTAPAQMPPDLRIVSEGIREA